MKMKTIRQFVLCLALFLAAGAPAALSQEYTPVPVTISRSTVSMNGRSYYAHIVLERQTLYGITKAYEVTEEDLYEANPRLKEEGLRSGTVLYIPVPGQKKAAPAKAKEPAPAKTKETAPAKTKEVVPDKEGYIKHTVKWFEDIYDIANAYGVTPQEIMDANGMKSSRISTRQVLLIPEKDKNAVAAAPKTEEKTEEEKPLPPPEIPTISEPVVAEPELAVVEEEKPVQVDEVTVEKVNPLTDATEVAEPAKETADEDDFDPVGWIQNRNAVEMALLLPFNASGKTSETNMDFYAGVLMALHDLEAKGVKATLNVYDLQAGIPSASELDRNDFILGPVSSADLTQVLDKMDGKVPVISPLDQRAASLADNYKGFIQAPPASASQYADLASWAAAEAAKGDKIILVTEKVSNSTAPAVGVRDALVAAGVKYEGVSWTLAEGRSLPSALTSRLVKGGVNHIIVASEREAFVGDMVRNLGILLDRGYSIVMYAPSRVRTFETVDGSAYHKSQLHISSPYYVDYDSDQVKSFIRAYRALYRTEPTQFAFQGYDLTRYFAALCAKYGHRWTRAMKRVDDSGLHTDFHFEEAHDGSFRNTAIRRIVYDTDYSTELVR